MIPLVGLPIWGLVKIFVVIAIFLYIAFALVVVRQVQLMVDTLEVGFERPLKFLSVMHLLFAISVLIFALIIL